MYISQIENEEQIENGNNYRTNWNKKQLENKPIIDSFFLFDINPRTGCRLHPHLVKYKFFTLSGYANNRTKRIFLFASAARYGTFFTLSYSYWNPH